jgi:hypothetical protein
MLSTLDLHMVPNHTPPVVYVGKLSLVPTWTKQAPTPGEAFATKDRLAWPSSWVTSFPLPHDSLGVGDRGFGQVVTQVHQLTEPITPTCDRYVQYLLVRSNPSVLNRHRRGYSLEGAGFPHTIPRPSQPMVLPIPPKPPPLVSSLTTT